MCYPHNCQSVLPPLRGKVPPACFARQSTNTRRSRVGAGRGVEHALINLSSNQISLLMATAVSDMRLEKPHSLSYHDMTRTSVPPTTLVWSSAKDDDAGLWLKSIETSGAS